MIVVSTIIVCTPHELGCIIDRLAKLVNQAREKDFLARGGGERQSLSFKARNRPAATAGEERPLAERRTDGGPASLLFGWRTGPPGLTMISAPYIGTESYMEAGKLSRGNYQQFLRTQLRKRVRL